MVRMPSPHGQMMARARSDPARTATLVCMSGADPSARIRREPPRFRDVTVVRVERLSQRLVRVTFAGPELEGLTVEQPAASVRLLLPSRGRELVRPTWNGNEFLLADGRRPIIRTFTPRRIDAPMRELDLDMVVHGQGAASSWAEAAEPGHPAAASGPGRGYVVDADAEAFVLLGDETAIAAVSQLLETLPPDRPVPVHVEVASPEARLVLPEHPKATVTWHDLAAGAPPGDTLVAVARAAGLGPGSRLWAAGEAAAMQRIRRHLFDDRDMARAHATVRGYWKRGRAGADET